MKSLQFVLLFYLLKSGIYPVLNKKTSSYIGVLKIFFQPQLFITINMLGFSDFNQPFFLSSPTISSRACGEIDHFSRKIKLIPLNK
jgi:hypothetical protein